MKRLLVLLALGALPGLVACSAPDRSGPPASSAPAGESASRAAAASADWFTDRAAESGLDFVHVNGATGRFYYPEILGPGVALFDYDNDGDLDVYLVQGRSLGTRKRPERGRRNRRCVAGSFATTLQVTPDGKRVLHFTDVTEASGLAATGYGMGVATGDFDNDGFVDLYLTNFGASQLYHNNGDGTFTDVTAKSGTADQPGFGVSAAFLDYDRDGWLDLYVGNNVNYRSRQREAVSQSGRRARLLSAADLRRHARSPVPQPGQRALRRRDVESPHRRQVRSRARRVDGGLQRRRLDRHLRGDDGEDNLLWINQRNGTFKESALAAGVAVTSDGKAEASMGVDAGDFDNDGDEDLIMTELTSQGSNLYLNDGHGTVSRRERRVRIERAHPAVHRLGHVVFRFRQRRLARHACGQRHDHLAKPDASPARFPTIRRNCCSEISRTGASNSVTEQAGAVFELSESGRGAAFGDIDNDGDIDVLVGNDAGSGAAADQQRRQSESLDRAAAGRSAICRRCGQRRRRARHARRARRHHAEQRPDAVAPRQIRWQLRLRQRSAGARRARRLDRGAARSGAMAGWAHRGLAGDGDRSMDDAAGGKRAVRFERPGGERGDLRAAGRSLQRAPGRFAGRVFAGIGRHAGRASLARGGPS